MKEHDEHEMPKPCMTWRHAIAAVSVWLRINHETVTLFENTQPNTRKLEADLEYSEFEFELPG